MELFTAVLWKHSGENKITNLGLLTDETDNLPIVFNTEQKVIDYIENDPSYSDKEYTIVKLNSITDTKKEEKYKKLLVLEETLDTLSSAKCYLNYNDYVAIWGEHLGSHIWYQQGSNLLTIWRSGLTIEQKDQLVHYIIKKDKELGKNYKTN